MNKSLYTPSKWGDRFHRLRTDEALGAGAAGPGKSFVLLMDPIQQVLIEHARCTNNPASVASPGSWLYNLVEENPIKKGLSTGWALHLRRLGVSLMQTISRAQRIFPEIDPGVTYSGETRTFMFTSGFRYQFGHCKDKDSWQGYLSQEYTHIAYDELSQFEEEQYDQINMRLRSPDPVLRNFIKIRAMSNPVMNPEEGVSVKDPFWVRRRFVEPCREGNKILKRKIFVPGEGERYVTSVYLPATIDDNPDKDFVEQYKARLASAPPHIRKAMLYGDWYWVSGSYYGNQWNQDLHVVRPFKIPGHWKRFRSMDWGFKQPGTCLWFAIDDDGNLVVEKELTFRLKHVDEVAEDIREIETDLGLWDVSTNRSLICGAADNQLWEERGDVVQTKADHFAELGIVWDKADKRSRKRNAEIFLKRLKDHENGTTVPGITFFDTCVNCINTIPTIPAKKTDPECPADGGPDHHHDAVLYGCAYVSKGVGVIPDIKRYSYDGPPKNRKPPPKRGRGYGATL